jgi:hypothetical protein
MTKKSDVFEAKPVSMNLPPTTNVRWNGMGLNLRLHVAMVVTN